MNSKVYAVVEFGGMYEDRWENIVGICSSSEIADKLKYEIEKRHDHSKMIISELDWENMMNRLDEAVDEGFEYIDTISGLEQLFPEYSEEDIKEAKEVYCDYSDWYGVVIKEIDFYTELSDISNNGTER